MKIVKTPGEHTTNFTDAFKGAQNALLTISFQILKIAALESRQAFGIFSMNGH